MKTIKNNFWNLAYKHDMRDLRPSLKVEVYNTLIEWGLDVNGKSDLHKELIYSITGEFRIQGEDESERKNRLSYSYDFQWK